MIKEYFKLMWRKALRNKLFTLINIFGLSVGIAVFILIMVWVQNEFSYDKYNKNIDTIYRIEIGGSALMAPGLALAFKNEFPEIEKTVRFQGSPPVLLTHGDKSITVNNIVMADSTLFEIFSYEFIYGNPNDALVTPYSSVLTESISKTMFGDINPVGKSLKINNRMDVTVTGVVKDLKKTHMPVDIIASFVTLGKQAPANFLNSFESSQFPTYFLLRDGVDIEKLTRKMTEFTNKLFKGKGRTENDNANKLVPLKDIYLYPDLYPYPNHLHGSLKFVYIFFVVSILILLIACINLINLTIAKSAKVNKEVGVKKVFGASKKQLFSQFLFESVILCFLSSLFAITIIQIMLPEFNQITGGKLSVNNYLTPGYIILYFLIVLVIGVLAGIYPAIKLSSFNPISYIRKFGGQGINRSPFRTGLVIFQFTISIVIIISVLVVVKQIGYLKNFNTGFNSEKVVVLRNVITRGGSASQRQAFRNEIIAIPGIKDISFSSERPGELNSSEMFSYQGIRRGFPVFTVDPSFLPLLEIKITEGRNFSWERPNDRYGACILNREAVELFGIENPVGKFLKHDYYWTTIPKEDIEIIGVIDDFHYISPKDSVGPALFCYGDWFRTISLKITSANMTETLKQVENVWKKFVVGYPFKYQMLDEFYGSQYNNVITLSRILIYFSFVAIFIACLGLLGLTSFLAQEKTKEIGVRKVFGATSALIIRLLSTQFLKWVVLAIIIGGPVAVIIMNKWLSNFAYHTSVEWWLVALGALILLSVSLLTIIFYILKVSRTNPIYALRYE